MMMGTIKNNTEKDNFVAIIKNKLQNYTLSIEEGSWNEIEKRLNAKPGGKKIVLWPWISGVSVAATVTLVWLLVSLNKQQYYDNIKQRLSDHAERLTEGVFTGESLSMDHLPSVKIVPVPVRKINAERIAGRADLSGTDLITELETTPVFTEKEESKKEKLKESITSDLERALIGAYGCPTSPQGRKKTKSLSIHFGSGGNMYAMNNNPDYNNFMELRSVNKISLNAPEYLANEMLAPDDFSEIVHRPPVSFGLSIRKELNNWLAVESGLTYTYLYSGFENKNPRRNAKLELHYVGIPVNLVVNLMPYQSSWNVYASAGGMVEKGLLSHYWQNTYENNIAVITTSNERIDGLQWSIQTALGIEYKFKRDYSIYLEPQINYYLDNNQPYNVRTEHPFAFGLNAGLRYTW